MPHETKAKRWIYSLDGRRCINAKLPIHTKSPGFGVKRGEYISPGINLFELCIGIIAMQRDDYYDVYTLRTSIAGVWIWVEISTIVLGRIENCDESKEEVEGRPRKEGERKRWTSGGVLVRVLTAVDKYRCAVRQSAIYCETYAPACGRHLETRDLFRHMRLLRECKILCFTLNPTTAWYPCTRIYEPKWTRKNEISEKESRRKLRIVLDCSK